MNITIIDSILSRADKKLVPHITPCLEYKKSTWKHGQYKRKQKISSAYFIHRGNGIFLTGLLPRVSKFLEAKNIKFKIKGNREKLIPTKQPYLKGITLRPDQQRLVQSCIERQRGVIISPTRSGKTIIAMSLMSMFPKAKVLFLCDTLDIISQAVVEMKKYGFGNIAKLGNGKKDWKGKQIVVSTIQTFVKLDPKEYCDYFDITIIDETHHCTGSWKSNKQIVTGRYGTVLTHNLSPIKIGFTATLPTQKEKLLSLEGLLGPVIGEVTQQEAIKLGITMKPKMELIPVPYSPKIGIHRKYVDLYHHGIVENRTRNKLIAREIKKKIKKNMTVLTMVKEIDHGHNIQSIAEDIYGIDCKFVRGETDSEIRQLLKEAFNDGKIKAVICTSVWREGVNIPNLNWVINAIGGKSEIMTLQAVGRGLTKTKGKEVAGIIDFLDPYHYLASHCIHRLSIYKKNNWI